jgi:hypothetical protein
MLSTASPPELEQIMLVCTSAAAAVAVGLGAAADPATPTHDQPHAATPATNPAVDLVPISGWKADKGEPASVTEVLVLSLLMAAHEDPSDPTRRAWAAAVLRSQDAVERAEGSQWAPPHLRDDPQWANNGLLLGHTGLGGAVTATEEVLAAIVAVVARWMGDGATESELRISDVKRWMQDCKSKSLHGPQRGKTGGSARHVGAAVRVARLLHADGPALKATYDAALATVREGYDERPESQLTKAEQSERHASELASLREDHEVEREEHEVELARLREEHEVEITNMQETEESLNALVEAATARARKDQKLRSKAYVSRGKTVTTTRKTRAEVNFARGLGRVEKRKSKAKGSKAKLESMGLFHSLSVEMREALITMAARDYHSELATDRADLEGQRTARRRKEELASEKGRESASEAYIDALYYYEMWGSAACWKTAAKADTEYAKLTSKSARVEALKEQIRIRVEGLGWSDLACAWSKDGVQFPPSELMKHLKTLVAEQSKRTIPTKPPPPGLARKELPALGKRTADVAALDAREASNGWALEAAARATKAAREAKGIGDSYQQRQGSKPDIDEHLVGKRVEVVCHYTLPDGVFGVALMWCAGMVEDVDPRPYTTFPKGKSATIKWDANNRVEPAEPVSTSGTKLLPSRWNKDGLGAWRMDLDPPPDAAA